MRQIACASMLQFSTLAMHEGPLRCGRALGVGSWLVMVLIATFGHVAQATIISNTNTSPCIGAEVLADTDDDPNTPAINICRSVGDDITLNNSVNELSRLTVGTSSISFFNPFLGNVDNVAVAPSQGLLEITDGSRLTSNVPIEVGQDAPTLGLPGGEVRVIGGGQLISTAGARVLQGSVLLSGSHTAEDGTATASSWEISGTPMQFAPSLQVGNVRDSRAQTTGTITVQDGGQLRTLGETELQHGEILVDGSGSHWQAGDAVRVGGNLAVSSGGSVDTTAGLYVGGKLTISGADSRLTAVSQPFQGVGFALGGSADVIKDGTLVVGSASLSGDLTVQDLGSSFVTLGDANIVSSSSDEANISVRDGATTGFFGALRVGFSGSDADGPFVEEGKVQVAGTNSSLFVEQLELGRTGIGELTVTSGGTLTTNEASLGSEATTLPDGSIASAGNGKVAIAGSDSVWLSNGAVVVGGKGDGSVRIEDGALFASDSLEVATSGSSTGRVEIVGVPGLGGLSPNSTLDVTGSVVVGMRGDGNLEIRDHAVASTKGDTTIGDISGAQGGLTVSNTSSLVTERLIVGGRGAVGNVEINGGSIVSSRTGELGNPNFPTSVGSASVSVEGKDSQWLVDSTLLVGVNGNGSLDVQGGAQVSAQEVHLGNSSLSTGALTISGGGSELSASGSLVVGLNGFGSAASTDGARIASSGTTVVGGFQGAEGNMLVSNGGVWTADRLVVGGAGGTGYLDILGGVVSSRTGEVGNISSSGVKGTGHVSVVGSGAQWSTSEFLSVGRQGNGDILIADGGLVLTPTAVVGGFETGVGSATVRDGGVWQADRFVVGGAGGNGILNIADYGLVATDTLEIGIHTNAGSQGTGTVVLSSSNAKLTANSLLIGPQGSFVVESGDYFLNSHALSFDLTASSNANSYMSIANGFADFSGANFSIDVSDEFTAQAGDFLPLVSADFVDLVVAEPSPWLYDKETKKISTLIPTLKGDPFHLSLPDIGGGLHFVPDVELEADGTDIFGLRIVDNPTIVLTHGWQPPLFGGFPEDGSHPLEDVADAIEERLGGLPYHIIPFVWPEAGTNSYPDAAARTSEAALKLTSVLAEKLPEDYSGDIHLIGHSLGTIVNAKAVGYLDAVGKTQSAQGDGANVVNASLGHLAQVTLLDVPFDAPDESFDAPSYSPEYLALLMPFGSVDYVDNYYGNRGPIQAVGGPVPGAGPIGTNGGRLLFADHTEVHSEYAELIEEADRFTEWTSPALRPIWDSPLDWYPKLEKSSVLQLSISDAKSSGLLQFLSGDNEVSSDVIDGIGEEVVVLRTASPAIALLQLDDLDKLEFFSFFYLVDQVEEGFFSIYFNDKMVWTMNLSEVVVGLYIRELMDLSSVVDPIRSLRFEVMPKNNSPAIVKLGGFQFFDAHFGPQTPSVSEPRIVALWGMGILVILLIGRVYGRNNIERNYCAIYLALEKSTRSIG